MKKTFAPVLTAAIVGLVFVGLAIAEPSFGTHASEHCINTDMKGPPPMDIHSPHMPFFLKGIKLTTEQEDKIFELMHAEVPKMRARMRAQREYRQDLMILIQSNKFEEKKARKIADKLAKIEGENALAKAHVDNSIMNLLTEKQREQVMKNKREIRPGHVRSMPTTHHNENLKHIAI